MMGMQNHPSFGPVFLEARKVTVNELHVRTFQCSPHPVAWLKQWGMVSVVGRSRQEDSLLKP